MLIINNLNGMIINLQNFLKVLNLILSKDKNHIREIKLYLFILGRKKLIFKKISLFKNLREIQNIHKDKIILILLLIIQILSI